MVFVWSIFQRIYAIVNWDNVNEFNQNNYLRGIYIYGIIEKQST